MAGHSPYCWEYWVYSELDGDNVLVDYVHMVVKGGDADRIGKNVVYDHFFNGWRDLVDQHYEYYFVGAPTQDAEDLAPDLIHTDLPFKGERGAFEGVAAYPYPKYYTAVVEGTDRNPFTFVVYAYKEDGSRLATWWPRGVISGGEPRGPGPVEEDLLGAGHVTKHASVRSYANWGGEPPIGDIWVQALVLESDVSCSTGGSKGKGKKQTSGGNAVITGTVSVTFSRDPLEPSLPPNYWWEGHFYDVDTGALSAKVAPTQSGGTWSFSLEMPDLWTGGVIAFVVDYLYPSGSPIVETDPDYLGNEVLSYYAYNPDLNRVDTWVHTLDPPAVEVWSNSYPSTMVGDERYPLAQSPSFPVVCN